MGFSWIVLAAICAVGLVKIAEFFYKRHVFRSKLNKIPGTPGYPIFGNYFETMRVHRDDRFEWFCGKMDEFKGGIFRTWLGEVGNVHITSPKLLEAVLPSSKLITKSLVYDYMLPWLGNGLLTSTGDHWHKMRKIITPSFHFNILEEFAVIMTQKAEILNECIEKAVDASPGKPIDIFVPITRCMLDIICESAMGIYIDTQRQPKREYTKAIHSIVELSLERTFHPWLHWDWLFYKSAIGKEFKKNVELTHDIAKTVVKWRKLARLEEEKEVDQSTEFDDVGRRKRKAFLDLLLDRLAREDHQLSEDEMVHEVQTFMFAGHDTTSVAVLWAIFCLGNSLDVQEKVHQELNDVFGDSTVPATQKQLAELKYLDRVIKESLRLYPSIPSVSRAVTEDIEIGGYTIPKGANLSYHIFKIHRDPEYWPNPTVFDPDRFLPENSKGRHSYAYIPFSAGPRNCIGQKFAAIENKIILTALLRKWRVKSVLTHDQMKCYSEFTLMPQNGMKIFFTRKAVAGSRVESST